MSSAKAALESDTRVLAFEVIIFMIFNNLAIVIYYPIFIRFHSVLLIFTRKLFYPFFLLRLVVSMAFALIPSQLVLLPPELLRQSVVLANRSHLSIMLSTIRRLTLLWHKIYILMMSVPPLLSCYHHYQELSLVPHSTLIMD